MMPRIEIFAAVLALLSGALAFAPASVPTQGISEKVIQQFVQQKLRHQQRANILRPLRMSEIEETSAAPVAEMEEEAKEEEPVDAATKLQIEKQKRADELRAQEVFMKRSTGLHKCNNCDFEYDPEKGDSFLIGGMIKPGTQFADLPSNWRCPTCRASKDNFVEVVETIPGFEVNQGYGFGTNAMTSGQKNSLIWGGLAAFFLLFIGGYALS
jgi:rubredoxin